MPSMRDAKNRHAKYFADLLGRANELYLQGGDDVRRGLEVLDQAFINIQTGQAFVEKSMGERGSGKELIEKYASPVDELLELRLATTERIRWSENALKSATQVSEEAIKAAQNIVDQAKLKADKILNDAKVEARKIECDAKSKEIGPLINLGNAYLFLAEYEKAQTYQQQALAITIDIEDEGSRGRVLNKLGDTLIAQGKFEEGIESLRVSLKSMQSTHNKRDESNCLGSLGKAYINLEQYEEAIEQYQGALLISREIGDKRAEARILNSIGSAWNDLEQSDEAIKNLNNALSISNEIGDRTTQGMIWGTLGLTYSKLRDYEQAQDCYKKSLTLSQQTDDRLNEASQLYNLGRLFVSLRNYESAVELFSKAVEIFEALGLKSRVDGVKKDLSKVQAARRFDPSKK